MPPASAPSHHPKHPLADVAAFVCGSLPSSRQTDKKRRALRLFPPVFMSAPPPPPPNPSIP
ncbi:MAG: hypothetical protein J0L63_00760 [Anaerolineae bacterium]|nr:hypothetical protein [Anaerolineae bacterium]